MTPDPESRFRHAHGEWDPEDFADMHANAIDVGRRPMRLGTFVSLCAGAVLVGALLAMVIGG